MVAQLSPEFTARLVDRWQELENAARAELPNFNDPVAAARAWADATEQRLVAQNRVTELEPKASAYDAFLNSEGLFGYQNAGRALGCRPRLFTDWLQQKFCFHQAGALIPRTEYVTAGLFVVKGERGSDGVTRARGWVNPERARILIEPRTARNQIDSTGSYARIAVRQGGTATTLTLSSNIPEMEA